jgi:secondary thiamine-phosphate synthase enzyme
MIKTIAIQTHQRIETINVTGQLAEMVADVVDGLAFFYIPHTTATLLICEDDEPLGNDLARVAEHWLAACRPFTHRRKNNPNAEAHILSAFGSHGVTIAIENGKLDLGTYQNLLLLEMDGPKQREIRCKVISATPSRETVSPQ